MGDDANKEALKPEPPATNPNQDPQNPAPIMRADLQIPQTVIDEYRYGQTKQDRREWWKLRAESLTLATVICYTIIAGYQGCKIREATDAAKTSADAANRAATTAERTFNQNKDFADSTLGEMKKQSTAMQGAAAAAKAQAVVSQRALDATIESSRLEQRAWVSANVSMPEIELDKPTIGTVSVINSGKTFAYKTVITINASFASHELTTFEESKKELPVLAPKSVALLAPNLPYQATITVPAAEIRRMKQYLGINAFTYIWGDITYYDVFRQPHLTQFCGYRSEDSRSIGFAQCKFHTDAN
jgi:hypothetical protein